MIQNRFVEEFVALSNFFILLRQIFGEKKEDFLGRKKRILWRETILVPILFLSFLFLICEIMSDRYGILGLNSSIS